MPPSRTNRKGYARAGAHRKTSTPAEARPWAFLRAGRLRGVGFRRQHAIGPYVVDFCAPRHRLAIEVDGGGHTLQHEQDNARTADLESRGYRVLRFLNRDVLANMDAVGRTILEALQLV